MKPLLDEQGITITETHLTASGQSFELAKLNYVRVERLRFSGLLNTLRRKSPVFRLIVLTATNASPLTVFQTEDAAFVDRIQKAMNQAARHS